MYFSLTGGPFRLEKERERERETEVWDRCLIFREFLEGSFLPLEKIFSTFLVASSFF